MPQVLGSRLVPSRRSAYTAGAAVLLAMALAIAILRVISVREVSGLQLGAGNWVMSDFKATAYYPAQDFAAGYNPYDSAGYLARHPVSDAFGLYPPATLLINQPLASFPLEIAMELEFAITVLLSGLLSLASLRLSGVRLTAARLLSVWGLILLSRPGQWNLLQGQVAIPMALGAYAVIALPARWSVPVGAALAVTLLKPTFGVPLAALLLARGQIRALMAGAGFTALVNLPPLFVLTRRLGGLSAFLHSYLSPAARLQHVAVARTQFSIFRVDGVALVSRWAGPLGKGTATLFAVLVLGAAAVALRSRRWPQSRGGMVLDPTTVGLICTATLLSVFHIGYDLLLLTWPCVALVWAYRRGDGDVPPHATVALGLYALLACNYLTSLTVLDDLPVPEPVVVALSSLNGVALLGLFGIYLNGALRPGAGSLGEPTNGPAAPGIS